MGRVKGRNGRSGDETDRGSSRVNSGIIGRNTLTHQVNTAYIPSSIVTAVSA